MHSNLTHQLPHPYIFVIDITKPTTRQDSKPNTQRKTHQEEFFDGDSCKHPGNSYYRSNCPAKGFGSWILRPVRHPSEGRTYENRRGEDEDCEYYTIGYQAECVPSSGREVSRCCFRDLFLSVVLVSRKMGSLYPAHDRTCMIEFHLFIQPQEARTHEKT